MSKHRHNLRIWLTFVIAIIAIILFNQRDTNRDTLATIQSEGVLRVFTRNGATTYYLSQGAPTGFEYHLAKAFAKHLGVKLEMLPAVGPKHIFKGLRKGEAAFAAAGLSVTEERKKSLLFGPDYMTIKQYFIYNRKLTPAIKQITDLYDKNIHVIGNSSHAEILNRLKLLHPDLKWRESVDIETIDLLEQLASGRIDVAIVDSNEFYANRAFYPDFRVALEAGEPSQLAWPMLNTAANASLAREVSTFFKKINSNGFLQELIKSYFTANQQRTFINTHTFLSLKEKRLPKLQGLIEQVAIEFDMDWRFIAAMSYQESHWKPSATSPTGVRGLMMLTKTTAKEMDISDREDPLQSLRGGSRYYKKMLSRLPSSIIASDRRWFALAAYNVGMGHLRDARTLTKKAGKNPDLWSDVAQHLPLLRQRQWYEKTAYGYARGDEPVQYVKNIRSYYALLTLEELNRSRVPPRHNISKHVPAAVNQNFQGL